MITVETSTGDVKVQRDTVDVVVQTPATSVQIVREGPQGKPGVQGVPGPQGAPGDLTRPVADALYERKLIDTAVWRVDAGAVGTDGKSLIDLSGGNRPAVFGAGAAAPLVLPYDGKPYLYVPSAAGNGATITTTGALPFTATKSDGTTITGTTPAGVWAFSTVGNWNRIATDDGAFILDPRNHHTNYTRIRNTGTAGGDWAITRASTGFKAAVVDRPLVLFGGGQQAVAPSIPHMPRMTIVMAMRNWIGTGIVQSFISQRALYNAGSPGWNLFRSSNQNLYWGGGGSNWLTQIASNKSITGSLAIRIDSDKTFTAWADGVGAVYTSATTDVDPDPIDNPVVLGGLGTAGTGYRAEMELSGAAIFDRALTDAEVARATAELLGTPHYAQTDPHPQYLHQDELYVGRIRTSRPNVDDRLVETWDGTKWVVTHYDSGWRDITSSLTAAATTKWPNMTARLRRIGNSVHFSVYGGTGAASSLAVTTIYNVPTGFNFTQVTTNHRCTALLVNAQTGQNHPSQSGFYGAGSYVVIATPNADANYMSGTLVGLTGDAIPTSLPGTLATPAS